MNRRVRLGLVAYEYSTLVGGMSTVARAMVEHLRVRGYEIHLFTSTRSRPDQAVATYPILTSDLARDLPRLAAFRMDLWHSVNFGYAPLALLKRPFVLTVHGNDFLSPWVRWKLDRVPALWRLGQGWLARRPVRRAIDATALRCVDQVVAVSRFTADLFRRECPYGRRPLVIPNGVEQFFLESPAGAEPIARHSRRLISVATLSGWQRKNIDGVIRAIALIGDRLDLEYWIVGDGTDRPALEGLARELHVENRVRFTGRVSQEELRAAYQSASLFVMVARPGPGDVEGFGLVFLEAAAAGTPSLGSRSGGITEAICEGQSGFFANNASPEAIADALNRFFSGQIRFDPTAVKAHAQRHTWTAALTRLEEVYAQVCSCRLSRAS